MVAIDGDTLVWNDNIYKSDIVMSAIRPYVNAIGKTVAKHILETVNAKGEREIKVNPEPYIRFLLEEPNPIMTGQKYREWMAACLKINNHAFALIVRDENGLPTALYPIAATMAVSEYDEAGRLYIRFYMRNGQNFVFAYSDLIHMRGDPCVSAHPQPPPPSRQDEPSSRRYPHSKSVSWHHSPFLYYIFLF